MKTKLTILSTIIGTLGCFSSAGMAGGNDLVAVEDQALILKDFDRLYIEAPVAQDLAVMNVRVFSPDNELLLSKRSKGESVEFLVGNDLPDGVYRYETVSIFGNVDFSGRTERLEGDTTLLRKFGTFTVTNGQIFENAPEIRVEDASLLDSLMEQAINLAGVTLDLLIPSAQADVFTSLEVEASTPDIIFDDTSTASSGLDWQIDTDVNSTDNVGNFRIRSWVGGNSQQVFRIDSDATTNNADSILVDPDGDIHWAAGGMNFDKGTSRLSIGTTSTSDIIDVSGQFTGIRLTDEFWDMYAGLENEGTHFYLFGRTNQQIVNMQTDAPANSIRVLSNGNVGIGMSGPAVPLDLSRSDGSAQVQVTETSGTIAARDLFRGKNNGPALFTLKDTSTSRTWAFTVLPEGFTMSRQGSGAKEFLILNNGDATLQGTLSELSDVNSKQDIVPVNGQNILEKISQLEISEWSYKDSPKNRHIGPMSQDFYKAFGLGGKKGVKGISTLDSSGVALAAIQVLIEDNKSLKLQNEALNARLGLLEQQQVEMQAVMMKVLEQQTEPVLTSTILN